MTADPDSILAAARQAKVTARTPAAAMRRGESLRRRRRRALGAGGVLASVIFGALVARVVIDKREGPLELDVAGPTTAEGTLDPRPSGEGASLTIDTGGETLLDGQSVTLTGVGFPPGQRISLSMCEQGVRLGTMTALCDFDAQESAVVDSAGGIHASYDLRRIIQTTNGAIDCGEAPGRCVLAAAHLEPRIRLVTAELTFVPVQIVHGYEVRPTSPSDVASRSTSVVVGTLTSIARDVARVRLDDPIEEPNPTTTVSDGAVFSVEEVVMGVTSAEVVVRQQAALLDETGEIISELRGTPKMHFDEEDVGSQFLLFLHSSEADLVVLATSDGVARVENGTVVSAGVVTDPEDQAHPLNSLVGVPVTELSDRLR